MLGVNFVTDTEINEIKIKNNGFIINNNYFDKVIVACGGKSSPHLGSNGTGYALLEKLGHKTTKLYPAITQIKTETEFVKQLKGIKADANCSIFVDNSIITADHSCGAAKIDSTFRCRLQDHPCRNAIISLYADKQNTSGQKRCQKQKQYDTRSQNRSLDQPFQLPVYPLMR